MTHTQELVHFRKFDNGEVIAMFPQTHYVGYYGLLMCVIYNVTCRHYTSAYVGSTLERSAPVQSEEHATLLSALPRDYESATILSYFPVPSQLEEINSEHNVS